MTYPPEPRFNQQPATHVKGENKTFTSNTMAVNNTFILVLHTLYQNLNKKLGISRTLLNTNAIHYEHVHVYVQPVQPSFVQFLAELHA